jgi:hypothetical protein
MSSSSFYLVKSNYNIVNATIEKADCALISDKQLYQCDLTLNYMIDGISISNQIIVFSDIKYEEYDTIEIEYDINNFLNISKRSDCKLLSLISGLSGIVLIFTFFLMYKDIKNNINKEIEKIMSYIPKFK